MKTSTGKTYSRPINRLYPLEAGPTSDVQTDGAVDVQTLHGKNHGHTSNVQTSHQERLQEPPKKTVRFEQPTHQMTTRSKTRKAAVGIVSTILTAALFITGVSGCNISCTSTGVTINVASTVEKTIVCCDRMDCILSHRPITLDYELSSEIRARR